MAKSAPFNAAAVTNNTLFSRSQNLCSLAVGCGSETNADRCSIAGRGMGASGSGPWATDAGQMPRVKRRAIATRRPEDLPGVINARENSPSNMGRGNPAANEPIWESRQTAQNEMLTFSFSLELRRIMHSFAVRAEPFLFWELTSCKSTRPSSQIRHCWLPRCPREDRL